MSAARAVQGGTGMKTCETCVHFDPLVARDSRGEVVAALRYCSHRRLKRHESDEGWATARVIRFSPPRGFGCVWHATRNTPVFALQTPKEASE